MNVVGSLWGCALRAYQLACGLYADRHVNQLKFNEARGRPASVSVIEPKSDDVFLQFIRKSSLICSQ